MKSKPDSTLQVYTSRLSCDGVSPMKILRLQKRRQYLIRRIDALPKDGLLRSAVSGRIEVPIHAVISIEGWQFDIDVELDCPGNRVHQTFDDPVDAKIFAHAVATGWANHLNYLKWLFIICPTKLGLAVEAAENLLLKYYSRSEIGLLNAAVPPKAVVSGNGSSLDPIAVLPRDEQGRPIVAPICLFSCMVPIQTIGSNRFTFQVCSNPDGDDSQVVKTFADPCAAREFAFLVANAEAERRGILQWATL